ncbi:MAG: regulatory iron-sulfur-containing complex subunit RicT, partial [candidate division WOR-3 bacterium]
MTNDPRPMTGNQRVQGEGPEPESVVVELHPFKSEVCVVARGVVVTAGDQVIIRDEEGEDLGRVVGPTECNEGKGIVLRKATAEDLASRAELDLKTSRVLSLFCRQKDEFGLAMKVVDAHWRWDRKKVCFYFVSDQRLDFRALHKVISSALNIRVAIKQIGVRDHARMVGGLGHCGRELCCRSFM